MSIRSRLFATVALPVFAAAIAVQPALAESLMAPFEVAQEGAEQPSPEELLLRKRRKQGEQESQGQAEEQQPQAEEQESPRRKRRQQQAEEQQRSEEAAPQQAEEQEAPRRKRRQQQAEEQPRSEEAAPQQAEEQETPRRKRRQQQAEEQRSEEAAPQQAEEQEAPRRKKRQQQAEEQQRSEEAAPQQAEEQEAPRRKKRQQQAEEQQRSEETAPQQAEEQEAPRRKKRQQQAEEQQPAPEEGTPQRAEEQQPAAEDGAPRQAEEQQTPRRKRQQQAEEQRQSEQPAERAAEGEQPVPGAEAPATAEQGTGEQPRTQRAPEVVDERTEEEKVKIAKDPAASDDTVVLPVENGAAVLDSDKDADNVGGNRAREARRKQREELRAKEESVAPPTDDAAAQAEISTEVREQLPQRIEANLNEEGQRIEEAPAFAVPDTTNIVNNTIVNNTVINNTTVNNTNEVTEVRVVEEVEDRMILGVGDRIFVRGDDRPRLRRDSQETFYDQLPRDRVRETIVRPDGYRIVTIYNRYGDIVQRSRVDSDGNEYLMIYAPEYDEDRDRPAIVDVGYELPPMRLTIPVEDYIVDYADEPDRDYYEFLSEPPVEQVERVYTIDEVRNSARLRDKVRRIDLDTIHFETGSAEVSMSQAKTLRRVADAMSKILDKDPGETFFIEGHTDAVGSDRSNLVLSDQRAESVAVLLSEVYGVPAENLVTQGYGERFLKVRTQDEEQENRRVTIRRVTPLVRPVAQR